MEASLPPGAITWAQLYFACFLVAVSFTAASWVILKLAAVLIRMEKLATREDLDHVKRDLYERLDRQWNAWMESQGEIISRITALEIRLGPSNGRVAPRIGPPRTEDDR